MSEQENTYNPDMREEAIEYLSGMLGFNFVPFIPVVVSPYKKFIDPDYLEEMQGIADATGLPLNDVIMPNIIWELSEKWLHCSEFAAYGQATRDGKLYHGFNMDTYDSGLANIWNKYSVVAFYYPEGKSWRTQC